VVQLHAWDLARKELQEERHQERERFFKEEIVSLNDPGLGWNAPSEAAPAETPPAAAQDADPAGPVSEATPDEASERDEQRLRLPEPPPAQMKSASEVPLSASLKPLAVQEIVRLVNLASRPELNRSIARIERWDPDCLRCDVRLCSAGPLFGELLSVKAASLISEPAF
ncbi:unnamed protein product, partial [Polarella glacialis]